MCSLTTEQVHKSCLACYLNFQSHCCYQVADVFGLNTISGRYNYTTLWAVDIDDLYTWANAL